MIMMRLPLSAPAASASASPAEDMSEVHYMSQDGPDKLKKELAEASAGSLPKGFGMAVRCILLH